MKYNIFWKNFGTCLIIKVRNRWICLLWLFIIAIQMKKKVDHWIIKSSSQFQPTTLQSVLYVLTPTRWLWRLSPASPPGRSSPAAPGAETQGGSCRRRGCKGWSRDRAVGDAPVYSTPLEPTPAGEPTTGTPPPAELHRTRRSAGLSNNSRYRGAEPGWGGKRKTILCPSGYMEHLNKSQKARVKKLKI